MSAFAKSAELVEELVDYDGPQLLLLNSSRHKWMFAVAMPSRGLPYYFFGCEATTPVYDRYFDNSVDLFYVFKKAMGGNYYIFDYRDIDYRGSANLSPAGKYATDPKNWPKIGFFARSHTSSYNRHGKRGTSIAFNIDGKWEASDFSRFHGKMSDIYDFYGVLDRMSGGGSAAEVEFLRDSILERFWQGGGSYVGFYDSLGARNSRYKMTPLGVDKIYYASPGQIVLRGDEKILVEIMSLVRNISMFESDLEDIYKKIYVYLKRDGLLSSAPTLKFSIDHIEVEVKRLAMSLADASGVGKAEELFGVCNENVVVFAKIVLSMYRRARDIHKFYAEGRVQDAVPVESSLISLIK